MAAVKSKSLLDLDCRPQVEEIEDLVESPYLHTITRKLVRSFKPKKYEEIFPIDTHFGVPIFDYAKMKEYVSVSLEKPTGIAASIKIRKTYGNSFQDLTKKLASRFSAGLIDTSPCGLVLLPCLSTQFNYSESMAELCRFYMVNTGLSYFEIRLPDPTRNREGLRSLLNPKFREMIDNINNESQAKQIVDGLGGGCYLNKASFGGFCQLLCTSEMVQDSDPQEILRNMELSLVDTFTIVSGDGRRAAGKKLKGVQVSAVGGHYSLQQRLPERGVEWTESILDNIDMIDFNLYPISKLAKEGSEQEQLLQKAVKMFIKRVIQPYEKFFSLGPIGKRPVASAIKDCCEEMITKCNKSMNNGGLQYASKHVIDVMEEIKAKLESHTMTEPQFRQYLMIKSDEIGNHQVYKPKHFRVGRQRKFYIDMGNQLLKLATLCEDLETIGH